MKSYTKRERAALLRLLRKTRTAVWEWVPTRKSGRLMRELSRAIIRVDKP